MKMLLIDDDDRQLQVIGDYLYHAFGAQIVRQATGLGGLDAGASGHPWQAVFIDRQLRWEQGIGGASGDGLTVAAVFRRDPRYASVPIIVYSKGWLSEDYAMTYDDYSRSGIFPCNGATGPLIESAFEKIPGSGPWTWVSRQGDIST